MTRFNKGDMINLLVEYKGPHPELKDIHLVQARMTNQKISPGIELTVHCSALPDMSLMEPTTSMNDEELANYFLWKAKLWKKKQI